MDDALKTRSIKNIKCWNSVVVFPSPNKISGYAPGCTAGIYLPKNLVVRFWFDIETDQIWIDYHNFLA